MRSRSNSGVKLDNFARLVQKTLLVNQDPITGLYPSNDAFDHAWVRDNLYTVQGKMFALNFFSIFSAERPESVHQISKLSYFCITGYQ